VNAERDATGFGEGEQERHRVLAATL